MKGLLLILIGLALVAFAAYELLAWIQASPYQSFVEWEADIETHSRTYGSQVNPNIAGLWFFAALVGVIMFFFGLRRVFSGRQAQGA